MLIWVLAFLTNFVLTETFGDLSLDVRPESYDITLDTNFETWKYVGYEVIKINVVKDIKEIKLHATQRVQIKYVKIVKDGKVLLTLNKGEVQNAAKDLLKFGLTKVLKKGAYLLKVAFAGTVSAKLTGYYRTGYVNKDGKYINMAATHLSPDKARTVFPCFDEPQFRAKFVLTLTYPGNLQALSNMPIVNEVKFGKNRKKTKFATTPSMSTYLLCWVCHNFVSEKLVWENVILKHHVRPSKDGHIKEKVELVKNALNYFNKFFGIKYPLPKLDSIGIPNYLVGGMENWGLITLSEDSALSSPKGRYGREELGYRTLICHEVSHMWFGNLVTMTWWNDLWLKEGMATYLAFPASGEIYSDVDATDQLITNVWTKAMSCDKMVTSHPVQMPIKTTKQITQIFDSITYKKGAMVLSMLRDLMGQDKFKAGMKHFLETYQYSVAQYKDLMSSMTRQDKDNAKVIRSFLDRFILQKNYPLITVKKLGERKIRITQTRYVRESGLKDEKKSPFSYSWFVPITVLTDTFTLKSPVILKGSSTEITLPKSYNWIKLNLGGGWMYVTNYSTDNFNNLFKTMLVNARNPDLKSMSHRDRGNVLHDLFAVAELYLISYEQVFALATYLRYEPHYLPWDVAYRHFRNIRSMIDEDIADCYRLYMHYLAGKQWRTVISKRHDSLVDELKFTSLYIYVRAIKGAREQKKFPDAEFKDNIKRYKSASKVERAKMNLLLDTTDDAQVIEIGNTLARYPSTDVSVIINFIQGYAESNPKAVWKVYKDNYDVYNAKYGLAQFTYADALKEMVRHQKDEKTLAEIENFFKTHSAGAGYLGYRNGLEAAKYTIGFKRKAEPSLKKYLRKLPFCS